jgi:hypothetical protein
MKNLLLRNVFKLLTLTLCLIISGTVYAQKTKPLTETEIRSIAQQLEECRIDRQDYKVCMARNTVLIDSVSVLTLENKELKTDYDNLKRRKWQYWLVIAGLVAGVLYYLTLRQRT